MVDPALIERFEAFRDLDEEGRAALSERMRRTSFEKGEVLVRMLERVQRVHLVLDGLTGLETVSVNGVRRIVWVFRPGDLIGSRAFLDDHVTDTEVRALTPGEAAVIAASDLERIVERNPEVGLAVARVLAGRFQEMAGRLLAATTLDVETRLARLLLDFGGTGENGRNGFRPLAYSMTHDTMAEIVGASRPHVSATLGEMEQRGAVRRGRRGQIDIDPDILAGLADSRAKG